MWTLAYCAVIVGQPWRSTAPTPARLAPLPSMAAAAEWRSTCAPRCGLATPALSSARRTRHLIATRLNGTIGAMSVRNTRDVAAFGLARSM